MTFLIAYLLAMVVAWIVFAVALFRVRPSGVRAISLGLLLALFWPLTVTAYAIDRIMIHQAKGK